MSWLDHHPDDIIERHEPAEALEQLRRLTRPTSDQLSKLDVYLHHWTLVLLQRGSDPEGVQEMLTLCEIASDITPDGTEGIALRHRWSGFEDLLEGKRRALQAIRGASASALKQQDKILQIIEQSKDGWVKQTDLGEVLQLSKGRVSQILGLLESRDLIARQRKGKESWVSRAPSSSAPATPPVQDTPSAPKPASVHIGANVFAWPKAA